MDAMRGVVGVVAVGGGLALCACGGGSLAADASVADASPLAPTRALDLLFVIDDSGTAQVVQERVIAAAPALFDGLRARFGGALPDVHLGVVSGDVGAGSYGITGCDGDGDDGALQFVARAACAPPSGRWIADADDGAGGRARNYDGALDEAFACIAALGVDGCGFQQHIEALRRALDGRHADHAGFARPDAVLAIVIVADDDDCSASDDAVFDPDAVADLGPLSLYRCARNGWLCDGAPLPGSAGTYDECTPRGDSLLRDPAATAAFLSELARDARRVVVAGVFADRSPVVIKVGADGTPSLDNICPGDPLSPNIRDRWLVDAFDGVWIDGCDANLDAGFTALAARVASRMGH